VSKTPIENIDFPLIYSYNSPGFSIYFPTAEANTVKAITNSPSDQALSMPTNLYFVLSSLY
jgi:hypothetical protein